MDNLPEEMEEYAITLKKLRDDLSNAVEKAEDPAKIEALRTKIISTSRFFLDNFVKNSKTVAGIVDSATTYVQDAEKKIEEGSKQLEEYTGYLEKMEEQFPTIEAGFKELEQYEAKLRDGEKQIQDGEKKLASYRSQIQDGEKKLADGRNFWYGDAAERSESCGRLASPGDPS